MQRLFAIILLICLHAQPALNMAVLMDFVANNDYIKEVLCINREKPELDCGGKCYLMQKLQESQSGQEQELPQLVHIKYEFICSKTAIAFNKRIPIRTKNDNFPKYTFGPSDLYLLDVFHPPNV